MNRIKKTFLLLVVLMSFLLVACNQSVEFTIYFDSKGGSEVSSISTGGNSAVVIPTNPIKEGFEFDGWYWDNNTFNRPFTANSLLEEPISSNMTVYAKWTSSEEEVLGIVTATGFEIDGTNMYIEVPNTTTTYSFIGQITVSSQATWDLYNDILGKNRIATKTISLSIGDNTVYIVVTKDDEIKLYTVTVRRLPIYEVSFNTDGGSLLESQFIQEDDMLQEPTTIKSGYTLIGWEDDNNEVTFPIEIEEDMLIKAKWEANQYTITFVTNGGTEIAQITQDYNSIIEVTTIKEGYKLASWCIDEGLNTVIDISYMPNFNATVYAKWEKPSTEGLMFKLKEDNTYEVIGYQGISTEIIIEHTYRGKTITSIGYGAFSGCSSLTSITIPSSVTSIGDNAFYGCSSLTNITIPSSVTSIGDYAFSGCSSLTSITIPSSVTSIGYGAFSFCSSLTSITIPSSVTSIGTSAFSGCSSLTSISLPFVGASRTATGRSALFGYIFGTTSYTGGSSTTQYSASSSSSTYYIPTSLKTVIITDATTLGYGVFYGCSSLTSITIPSSVTSIGYGAFYGCSSLTSITIPSSVTSIDNDAFSFCSSLTSVVIPNSVTSIGDWAFKYCRGLTSITIPTSVTSIGACTFWDCSSLTSIVIPSSVTSIGDKAFSGCSSLASITIPTSVTSIGSGAFSVCSGLTSITIPSRVTSIGERAFWECSSLTSITIPSSVTSIGDYAFRGCSRLTSITIPSSVTSIGDWAFYFCSSLTNITIPSSVTSIGAYAFLSCSGLTIYAEASSKPAGWSSSWNYDNRPVVWGYTGE